MIARDVNVRVLPCPPAFSRLLPPSPVFARPIFKSLYIETAIPRNESYTRICDRCLCTALRQNTRVSLPS